MTTAAEVLRGYVEGQVATLEKFHDAVIADLPDAVHKSRVATRRLRSLLRTFRPLLDVAQTQSLRGELAWWADILGAPRDAEVMRDLLIGAVESLRPDQRRGPVMERIRTELEAEHAAAHAHLIELIDGERAAVLRECLRTAAADLPTLPEARCRAHEVLPPLVEAACARVDKTAKAASKARGLAQLSLWHETRKKAKAARYAGEAVVEVFGAPALALGKVYEAVTEALGQLQDSVIASAKLVDLAHRADAAGESTVTYWTLIARERSRAAQHVKHGRQALAAVEESGVRAAMMALMDPLIPLGEEPSEESTETVAATVSLDG